jgi:Ran GTPase-activating protein (RanGAP) involved in mRNA processing and transport
LDLSYTELRAEGAKALAPAIRDSASLTDLNLFGNNMGEEGGAAIAESLKYNTSLVRLKSSFLGRTGCEVMAEALQVMMRHHRSS